MAAGKSTRLTQTVFLTVRVVKTASKMSNPIFSENTIREGVANYGTPFWIYDRATIEKRVQELKCFDTVRFAQKACPNLSILSIVRNAGAVVDAVSAGEIIRALRAGYKACENDKQVPCQGTGGGGKRWSWTMDMKIYDIIIDIWRRY